MILSLPSLGKKLPVKRSMSGTEVRELFQKLNNASLEEKKVTVLSFSFQEVVELDDLIIRSKDGR